MNYVLDHYGVEEAMFLRDRLVRGEIDGSTFWSRDRQVGCFIGTLEVADMPERPDKKMQEENPDLYGHLRDRVTGSRFRTSTNIIIGSLEESYQKTRAAQRMFRFIHPGDTPETSPSAEQALGILDRWLASRTPIKSVRMGHPIEEVE